jgi:hypothetical protein
MFAFGSSQLVELLYIERSVETVPYGDYTLCYLDWNKLGNETSGLGHSAVCESKWSLEEISKWICLQISSEN